MRRYFQFAASFEIWVVGLFTAASFIFTRFLPLAVGCILVFILIRWAAYGRLTLTTSADIPIILLLVMLGITIWVTSSLTITVPQVLRALTGIGLYYAIANWTNSASRLRWLMRGVWGAGCLLALYGFISAQWNSTKLPFIPASLYSHFQILVSDTTNPNVLGGTLVLLLPCALGVLWFNGFHLSRIDFSLAVINVLVLAIGLVLSQSRGGLMAMGVILVMLVLLRWRRGWMFLGVILLIGSVFLAIIGPAPILSQVLATSTISGIDGRLEIWSRAVYIIQDFPFTGIGMGSFDRVTSLLYPFFMYAPGTAVHAHNLFLQVAVDLGLPGLIAWVAIWLLMILLSWQVYQHGQQTANSWACGLGAGFICSQLALVTHGMLDATTWGIGRSAPLVWLVWGSIVAAWYIYNKRL